jgi:two-component system, OmpR family, phosphate regulon sensor histidine kinase PhoR
MWKVAPAYMVITLLAVMATGWLSIRNMRSFYLDHTREDLELRARLLMSDLPDNFPSGPPDSLQAFCSTLRNTAQSRITLIDNSGRVLGDSDADPRTMENHSTHPEVRSALAGASSFDIRFSSTLRKNMMYFALPVRRNGQVAGVLRTSVPLTTFESALATLRWNLVFGAFLVLVLAAVVTMILSRRVSRPIAEMVEGAEKFAAGDFSQKLYLPESEELAALAETLNRMALELDARIRELTTQRNEQQAVLSSMREGVLAIDTGEHLLFMNLTAGELLGADAERSKGRLLQEVIRNSELQKFLVAMLHGNEIPAPREIRLAARGDQVIQVSGSFLRDANGDHLGVLAVLNDVTRLRKLEGLRREFVANVSHELKTPITTIKGFVETLREGALEDPEYARSFLERIAQNVDRLNVLIEDLLSLSRIEQDVENSEILLVPGSVRDIVQSAVLSVVHAADAKKISVKFLDAEDCEARINSTLLEQAVINLLDNAIKYSEPGKSVEVQLERREQVCEIQVRDQGCGIEEQHLPRLFERFYRVDKARSRKMGGTGLGLAIVKHIVEAHKGTVTVKSTPGAGSVFTLSIPSF